MVINFYSKGTSTATWIPSCPIPAQMLSGTTRLCTNAAKVAAYCELPTRFLTPNRELIDMMCRNLAQSLHDARKSADFLLCFKI
jgi:hypothetical protein